MEVQGIGQQPTAGPPRKNALSGDFTAGKTTRDRGFFDYEELSTNG